MTSSAVRHEVTHQQATAFAQQQLAHMQRIFFEMDADGDGRVSQQEFRRYLFLKPHGWPLGDLLAGQTEEVRNNMITFWFRKLDQQHEGSFDASEFANFYMAMQHSDTKELMYADFLITLFDVDMDEKLEYGEVTRMLRVLLGHEPKHEDVEALLAQHPTGLTKADLRTVLHNIHCQLSGLEASTRGSPKRAAAAGAVQFAPVVGGSGDATAAASAAGGGNNGKANGNGGGGCFLWASVLVLGTGVGVAVWLVARARGAKDPLLVDRSSFIV